TCPNASSLCQSESPIPKLFRCKHHACDPAAYRSY
ncbi:SAGA-associated factor 29 protein, partial [Danaus plexippus plexippus]